MGTEEPPTPKRDVTAWVRKNKGNVYWIERQRKRRTKLQETSDRGCETFPAHLTPPPDISSCLGRARPPMRPLPNSRA